MKVRILVWIFFKRRYAAAGATRHARAYFLMKLASRPLKPNLKTAKNSAARPETGVLCRPEAGSLTVTITPVTLTRAWPAPRGCLTL